MDEIQVINSALTLLGDQRITSLDDGSELATVCGLRFAMTRDAVLELHTWNFAMRRKTLPRSTIVPASGWRYQYPLPGDCLAVRTVNEDASAFVDWEVGNDAIDGRILLTNDNAVDLAYTTRVDNLNIWHSLAVLALTYLLAADLSQVRTGQQGKAEQWRRVAHDAIAQAMSRDAREGTPVRLRPPTGLSAIR